MFMFFNCHRIQQIMVIYDVAIVLCEQINQIIKTIYIRSYDLTLTLFMKAWFTALPSPTIDVLPTISFIYVQLFCSISKINRIRYNTHCGDHIHRQKCYLFSYTANLIHYSFIKWLALLLDSGDETLCQRVYLCRYPINAIC